MNPVISEQGTVFIAAAVIGLAPMLPTIEVVPVLVMPDLVRIAKLFVLIERRSTGAGPTPAPPTPVPAPTDTVSVRPAAVAAAAAAATAASRLALLPLPPPPPPPHAARKPARMSAISCFGCANCFRSFFMACLFFVLGSRLRALCQAPVMRRLA